MKLFKQIPVLILCLGLLLGTSSCLVLTKQDNGKHKGWHKGKRNHGHSRGKKVGRRTKVIIYDNDKCFYYNENSCISNGNV